MSSARMHQTPKFSLWTKLPAPIRRQTYQHVFHGALSTYLFAPGSCHPFKVTHSAHRNILLTSKSEYSGGIGMYFSMATVVFRGYERIMHDVVSELPCLTGGVVVLHVPLHFVRWMILRYHGLARFKRLRRIVMEDMSVDGFDIEGENPGDSQILNALYGRDTEIRRIYDLLCDPDGCVGGIRQVEVLFQFELFTLCRMRMQNEPSAGCLGQGFEPCEQELAGTRKKLPLAGPSESVEKDEVNIKQELDVAEGVSSKRGGNKINGGCNATGNSISSMSRSKDNLSPLPSSVDSVSEYLLNVRTRKLTQTGIKLRIKQT